MDASKRRTGDIGMDEKRALPRTLGLEPHDWY